MRPVHEDERSILYCDREPIRWGGERERGYAWIEGDVWRGDPSSWEEASRLGACGLALDGRRRLVHTSVSGYARLYWIEDRGATYFASRVDPLVRAWPRPLSVDWDAWAATIIFRHPVGGRTPFAEIRRLGPARRTPPPARALARRAAGVAVGGDRAAAQPRRRAPTHGSARCARCWPRSTASSSAR